MRPLLARLLAMFHRRRLDDDLSDEISAHLELSISPPATSRRDTP
jgi:hypothetical protein